MGTCRIREQGPAGSCIGGVCCEPYVAIFFPCFPHIYISEWVYFNWILLLFCALSQKNLIFFCLQCSLKPTSVTLFYWSHILHTSVCSSYCFSALKHSLNRFSSPRAALCMCICVCTHINIHAGTCFLNMFASCGRFQKTSCIQFPCIRYLASKISPFLTRKDVRVGACFFPGTT